jgi:hypothetical protein
MRQLHEKVHPKDHTPKVMSNLRNEVVEHGKTIMELGVLSVENLVKTFWDMLEIVDEGVAERISAAEAKKKQEMPTFSFELLPNDLITSICQYLDVDTLVALSKTSRKYKKMADKPLIWKYAVLTLYKDMPEGYNRLIDGRGGRYLLDRVQRIHVESAYIARAPGDSYVEHYHYKVFTWNLWSKKISLPVRELVCPWRLITKSFLNIIRNSTCSLQVLRFTGTEVMYGFHLEREFAALMDAHKDSLRELDAIPSIPFHMYFEQEKYLYPASVDDSERKGATKKICESLRSMVHLEKVSLPLARTRSSLMLLSRLFEQYADFRKLPQFAEENPNLDREMAGELRTCELIEIANRELIAATRCLPALREVSFILHTKGSIVDTIAETLHMYLGENNIGELGRVAVEQGSLQLIRFEQRQEIAQISINSYDDTPKLVERLDDDDLSEVKELSVELFDDDPYMTLLLKTATGRFITVACRFFERYPDVHLKIQLRGDYWNKLYAEMVLPQIPAEFHPRLSFLEGYPIF